jgi:hypothetical protein
MLYGHTSKVTLGLIGCTLLATLATAQKINVESNHDQKADFSALRTYGWLPSPPVKTDLAPDAVTDPRLTHEVLGPHIIAAVDRELAMRGLQRIEEGEPDVRVVYYAALKIGINAAELGSYYQYTTGWIITAGPALPTTSYQVYEQGTIIVDLVSRKSNTAIWRGSASTNVNHENSQEKRIARIQEATTRMFERFPVRPVKKR